MSPSYSRGDARERRDLPHALPFSVDRWTSPDRTEKNKVFFLTHLHSDHTKGLSERWQAGPIYCSSITCALLFIKFPSFDRSLVHCLPLESPSLISIPGHNHLLEVTAIDADHCPGSVMFVFRGPFGCILHTGDFRWEATSPRFEIIKRGLAKAISGSRVDLLCLDNTFCNAGISFPSRHVAAQQVLDIIVDCEEYDVILGIDMLGKEELLISIADALQTKIWVWPERMQTMRLLGISDFFTSDRSTTRIHAVPRYSVSSETLRMLNEIKPTIAILPSGVWSLRNASTSKAYPNGDLVDCQVSWKMGKSANQFSGRDVSMQQKPFLKGNIYFVSYSLHSCFLELKDFIEFVNPVSMKGNTCPSHVDTSVQSLYHGKVQNAHSRRDIVINRRLENFNHNGSARMETVLHLHSIIKTEKGNAAGYLNLVDGGDKRTWDDVCGRKRRSRNSLRKIARLRSKLAWASLQSRKGGGSKLANSP